MNRFKLLYILFIALFFTTSCEKDANIELPKADPKLVVYSYISPSDTFVVVEVTKSKPFFGNKNNNDDYNAVEDAAVEIFSSNGQKATLPYDAAKQNYNIPNDGNFSIIAGQTYSLKVTAPGGFSCSATTTVPSSAPPQFMVKIDSSIRTSNGYSEKEYRIISTWNDIAGISNFYHSSVRISNNRNNQMDDYTACNTVSSDDHKDGSEIGQTCIFSGYYDPWGSSASGISGRVFLLTTDISYYKYHETLYRYEDDNPFSEPVQIYTNIEGGLGCFGSFLEQSRAF